MRSLRRVLRCLPRQLLAVAALLSQLLAATGAPVLSPRTAKAGATPFPCQNHPCGCTTPEQGWAGDCCCFTLEQKLAWAEERGVEPPAHVRPAVEARRKAAPKHKAKPACCAKLVLPEQQSCCDREPQEPREPESPKAAPAVKWVAGVFAQKCRGEGPAGLLKLEASIAPALPSPPRAPLPGNEFARPADARAGTVPSQPLVPPPRVS